MVVEKDVCDRWCVCDKDVCDKVGGWQSCVWKMVVDKDVCERLRDKDVWDRWMCVKEAAAEEAADEEEVAGYRIKNKNPTQRCGEQLS